MSKVVFHDSSILPARGEAPLIIVVIIARSTLLRDSVATCTCRSLALSLQVNAQKQKKEHVLSFGLVSGAKCRMIH